jgi:hypothetical protein
MTDDDDYRAERTMARAVRWNDAAPKERTCRRADDAIVRPASAKCESAANPATIRNSTLLFCTLQVRCKRVCFLNAALQQLPILRKPALDLSDVVRQTCTLITEHRSECIRGTVAGFAWPRRAVKPNAAYGGAPEARA